MRPLRVLIIEDDEDWRDLIRKALAELEPEIDEAENQQQAERRTGERTYDLITVDLSLVSESEDADRAGEEGLALLEQIRRGHRNRDAAILVLTGYPTFERFDRVLRFRQAHRLLTKPRYSEENLRSAVREALREARLASLSERSTNSSDPTFTVRFLETCWIGCQITGPHKAD